MADAGNIFIIYWENVNGGAEYNVVVQAGDFVKRLRRTAKEIDYERIKSEKDFICESVAEYYAELLEWI